MPKQNLAYSGTTRSKSTQYTAKHAFHKVANEVLSLVARNFPFARITGIAKTTVNTQVVLCSPSPRLVNEFMSRGASFATAENLCYVANLFERWKLYYGREHVTGAKKIPRSPRRPRGIDQFQSGILH